MLARQEQRLWQKLLEIHQRPAKEASPGRPDRAARGPMLGRYPAADRLFEVEVQLNERQQAWPG